MASIRKRGKVWYVRYRTPDGKQTEVKAGTDKRAAETLASRLDVQNREIRLGLVDPRESACRAAEVISLWDHVQDYLRVLEARGCVPAHVAGIRQRLEWFLGESQITRLSQLRPSVVLTALQAIRDARKSDRTLAHYIAATKGFSRWAWKDRRTREDMLADLERPSIRSKRPRVVLTPEEATRLIAATRTGKTRRGMSGEDRSWFYTLAMTTGLRRSELQALRPENFDLGHAPPLIRLSGAHTKNGRDALQPLPTPIVLSLRSWLSKKPPHAPLFPADRNSAIMYRADLRDAGISSDHHTFHELRHCYATWVVQSGASIKDAMTLVRHHDADLTLNTYAHTSGLATLAHIVDGLPTSGLWASLTPADSAHTLPTSTVPASLTPTHSLSEKTSVFETDCDTLGRLNELPGQDSNLEKQDQNLL